MEFLKFKSRNFRHRNFFYIKRSFRFLSLHWIKVISLNSIIIYLSFFTILSQATEDTSKISPLVTPEFDWRAWERLSLAEKERNTLWRNKEHPEHCEPLKEYRAAMDFFRFQRDELSPSEQGARQMASEISKGCEGATQRFVKTFVLLKKSGVDQTRAMYYGVQFANSDNETTENFSALFKKIYLGEFFDLDYSTALNLSYELSLNYKGNRKLAREDFLEISKFCLSKEGMNLSVKQCAEISFFFTRLSQFYPNGIQKDFFNLYKSLREDRRFGVSVQTALRIIKEVMPFGPTAPSTFLKSYEYAIDPSGLSSGGIAAVKFAVTMSKRAVKQWPPPVYTPPILPLSNLKIHEGYGLASEYKSDSEKRNGN